MHQRKSKKILIYLFLLFLVGSINNIHINNLNFLGVKEINVTGLENKENSTLSKKIKNLKLDNIYLINKNDFNTLIESNNLVEKYFIFKRYLRLIYNFFNIKEFNNFRISKHKRQLSIRMPILNKFSI